MWHAARGTELDLPHLEVRLRQTGHVRGEAPLDVSTFRKLPAERIDQLDVAKARADVERFVVDRTSLEIWSREFFHAVAEKIPVRAAG